jgi:protein-S-isoprenylcysteine O-methyltransferase Ste14
VPSYGYLVVVGGWVLWAIPFVRARLGIEPAKVVDRRARWGVVLVGIGYGLLWQGRFWERSLPAWRLAIAICFLLLAALLSWTGTRALGRQWRIDAGLSSDHELITAGPYRVVRHPIYASMLCLFLGTGLTFAPPWLFAIGTVFFFAGTEIRVRIEERLLASRFGDTFAAYRRRVPAYIPLVR